VAVQVATDGFENMLTSLGVRHVGSPQALSYSSRTRSSPAPVTAAWSSMPLVSASHLSLRRACERPPLRAPNTHHLSVGADTVPIIHPEGVETAEADPAVLQR